MSVILFDDGNAGRFLEPLGLDRGKLAACRQLRDGGVHAFLERVALFHQQTKLIRILAPRRRELAQHHGHQRPVRGHELPGEKEMRALMRAAGLACSRIVDEAGRYLATGERPMVPSNRST